MNCLICAFRRKRAWRVLSLMMVACCLLVLMQDRLSAFVFSDDDELVYDCYAGSPLDSVPNLQLPPRESWRNWLTRLIVITQGAPYHMVHDLVVAAGQDQIIVGKFDYGIIAHKDLEYERVHVYIYGTGMSAWQKVGVYTTNSDGKIYVTIPRRGPGEYMIKMVVAGDLSTTYGFMTVLNPGRKAVVFDIDGTLTTNDFEVVKDYTNVGDASPFYYASNLVNLYRQRGYQIIYLTARPYWVVKDTRAGLKNKGFADTILHATLNNTDSFDSGETEEYKRDYLLYLLDTVEIEIVAAYGNADSDIGAYLTAGIPANHVYIIGNLAGEEGTVPINDNYYVHYNMLLPVLQCGY